jgi:hypothetical protein
MCSCVKAGCNWFAQGALHCGAEETLLLSDTDTAPLNVACACSFRAGPLKTTSLFTYHMLVQQHQGITFGHANAI